MTPNHDSAVSSGTKALVRTQPGLQRNQQILVVRPACDLPAHLVEMGPLPAFRRFMACHRNVSCWMQPAFGKSPDELPSETQFILLELESGYLALHPLVDGSVRCSLEAVDGTWMIRLETGNADIPCGETRAVMMTWGDDPYELLGRAVRGIAELLKTVRLRADKCFPESVKHLGWCSWNAFYENVGATAVLALMEQLDASGLLPKLVILDGGWQQSHDGVMTGFDADPVRFPGGLGTLISRLKAMGVDHVFVWQTYNGYWQGASVPALGSRDAEVRYFSVPDHLADRIGPEETEQRHDTMFRSFYPPNLLEKPIHFPKGSLFAFYDDFHGCLARAGVDGVKIDAMTWIEALTGESAGRVAAVRDMVHSAEASTAFHFGGGLIHCSSCSNDFLYSSMSGAIVRTSGDFMPEDPASHGRHLMTNALVALWTSPFLVPDWDMFQSGHRAGTYHAAARAISGGPVYVTDAPGGINPETLRRLRFSDGSLPLCLEPAVPARDSIFEDVVRGDRLLQLVNRNETNMVFGAFHCGADDGGARRTGRFRLRDLPWWEENAVAIVWSEKNRSATFFSEADFLSLELGFLEFEILTVAPVHNDLALIGNVNLLNPGGAIKKVQWGGANDVVVSLRDGGTFLAWSQDPPALSVDGESFDECWNPQTRLIRLELDFGKEWKIRIGVGASKDNLSMDAWTEYSESQTR
jgi:raffinose synthase